MKLLFCPLLILVFFSCSSKNTKERFLRDCYQLPDKAVQVIEWTYTTRQTNASVLPDVLTSNNREFKFNDDHLVEIIAFDSISRVSVTTDIVYSGDSLLITEHQHDGDFVIDITQRENQVVFTKSGQKDHAPIETMTMTYDSVMSRVVRKVYANGRGTIIKEELFTYDDNRSTVSIRERTPVGTTIEKVASLSNRNNTWEQMRVNDGGKPVRLIARIAYFRDMDLVTMEYKK